MLFQLLPNSVTLNDLERRYGRFAPFLCQNELANLQIYDEL